MGISAITIENFKGIKKPIRVELKPITMLFGPNSAGKSTIIQALHYARELFERGNTNPDTTLLGGDLLDLGGFEALVNQHDKTKAIRIDFELDLQNEKLPEYRDGFEEIGTDLLDNSDSAYLLRIIPRLKNANVAVLVKWSKRLEKAYISSYSVHANGEELITIDSSSDKLQIHISKINIFNPIFFDEKIDPEDNRNLMLKYIEKSDKSGEKVTSDFWSNFDKDSYHLGDMFTAILHYTNLDNGVFGCTKPIKLLKQDSGMPYWDRNLIIDYSIWAPEEDIKFEDRLNFIRLLSSLAVGPGELVRNQLRKLCYFGPLREVPKRGHKPAKSPNEFGWANGLAAYDNLSLSDDTFVGEVNEWLGNKKRLNSGYSVGVKKYCELQADSPLMKYLKEGHALNKDDALWEELRKLPIKKRLLIRDEAKGLELEPQDIGVGISQVLPVIVASLHHKIGVVAIEQPELHIHPAFQVALGDLFIEQIREYPDLTFILETHSEHLMLRFLRRVRETCENEVSNNRNLMSEELSIYFMEQDETGIVCTPIGVDKNGDFIDRWPRGFFDERFEELY